MKLLFPMIFISLSAAAKDLKIPIEMKASTVSFQHQLDEDLIKTYYAEKKQNPEQKNQDELSYFYKATAKEASGISLDKAQALLVKATQHPVVGLAQVSKYSPDHSVGFCFGRAMYIHLELVRMGIPPESLAKVFAIGDLVTTEGSWEYHMATIVKSDDKWIVIDPLLDKVLPLEAWLLEVKKWSSKKPTATIRFYFTDALKFQASLGKYHSKDLQYPYFHNYFRDMLQSLVKNP